MTVVPIATRDSTTMATNAVSQDDGGSNVKVIVRVRPPNELERNGQSKTIVEVMNENVLVFDPKEESSPGMQRFGRRRPRDIHKRRQKDMKFAFDRVFGSNSNNDEVFEVTTKTVLEGLMSGYNCSVFAYGATGAGKTHTMLGSEQHPGVIYHTMIHLYKEIGALSNEKTCDIAVSYLEIYNEQIRDLLMPRGTLPIREDPNTGVMIPGLSLHKPSNAEELLYMLQFGNKNRTQHPTDANAESSRSHAVFQVFVRQKDRTANISAEVRVAKMCLVDLAGSERATVNRNRGARFREGANINRSLLALGNVINALADQKYKGHIPYRDSKLTRLLKDSLGGNCRTIMIAAVSPSHLSYEDTYNTLKYADRAKNIRLNMKKNVLNVDFHISRYGKIVEELRREITELKNKLQEGGGPQVGAVISISADLQSLRLGLQVAYNDRRSLRDKQLKQETSVRDVQWRFHCTQKCLNRALQLSSCQPKALQKMHGVMAGLQKKLTGQETQRQTLSQQLQDSTQKLTALQSQIMTNNSCVDKNSLTFQLMETSVQKLGLELELNECRHYIRHLRRLARAQEREAVSTESLIFALLGLVQRQHAELERRGTVPQEIGAGYQAVCESVGQWGVTWVDTDAQDNQTDGRQQEPFHINSILDIPLITNASVSVDRVPMPGQVVTVPTVCPDAVPAAKVNQNSAIVSCPGRIVNGQIVFTNTTPNAKTAPSRCENTTPNAKTAPSRCENTTPNKTPAARVLHPAANESHLTAPNVSMTASLSRQSLPLAPSGKENCMPNGADSFSRAGRSENSANSFNPGRFENVANSVNASRNGDYDFEDSPSSTIYAGHTPNPKKHGGLSAARGLSPGNQRPLMQSQPNLVTSSTDSSHALAQSAYVMVPVTDVPHSMNETFSLDASVAEPSAVNRSTNGPTVLTVPVIDNSLSASGRNVAKVGQFGTAGSCISFAQSGVHLAQNNVHLSHNGAHPNYANPADSHKLNNSQPPVIGNACSVNAQNGSTKFPVSHSNNALPAHCQIQATSSKNTGVDENAAPCGNQQPQAKRAIDFGIAFGTPQRVEKLSYADVVKTPSPVVSRQPLQNLDCNSPQVHARTLSASYQTPKTTGRSSMYVGGPQTYDNMRRLKQMGMPSLVENLITGNKTGGGGGGSGDRPSYMQPTKATALRVKQYHTSQDDTFRPKRVEQKSLAHSRSKSTSMLSKSGWKL